MIDYFTYVSSIHQTQRADNKEDNLTGQLEKARQVKISNDEVDIGKVMENAPNLAKTKIIAQDLPQAEKKPTTVKRTKKTTAERSKEADSY